MSDLAKVLIVLGFLLMAAGGLLLSAGKFPGIGKLPGDIFIQKGNFTFYFPIVTCLIISLILTFIFSFFKSKT